jgi:oligoendopeptidase F
MMDAQLLNSITTVKRTFLPPQLEVHHWDEVQSYFTNLLNRSIDDSASLQQWLSDRSELEAFLQEDLGWRYIRMSGDTANEEYTRSYNVFVGEIQPRIAPLSHRLDIKLIASRALNQLQTKGFMILLRQVKERVALFREENIPLIAELQQKEQEYSAITGAMVIEVEGKEITLYQAANYLESSDRKLREEVYRKIAARRLQDADKIDALFDDLAQRRQKIAFNAGFSNFRDYMFAYLGRFDYSPDDCFRFHESVSRHLVPLVARVEEQHRLQLGLDDYRPWDHAAEPAGVQPLRPSANGRELMDKTIACFDAIDPFLGDCMREMDKAGRIDLESRKGKAPGGYNYPLYESGLPFIFMNATNSLRDLVTMVHEGGHAVQSILNKNLGLVDFKNIPSEIAELASMSMELISMEHWDLFFEDKEELKRARRKHLEEILEGLPWIAAVDDFQHRLYTNHPMDKERRAATWNEVYNRFTSSITNWTGMEHFRSLIWQKQLHIFEVPFYYIEYGFAQLGAIAIWRNYLENPARTLKQYKDALSLGYTCTIAEMYEAAGVRFDFSDDYIRDLAGFVSRKLEELQN